MEDNEEAADYGIELLPALMYFENKIPSLYDEDLANVSMHCEEKSNKEERWALPMLDAPMTYIFDTFQVVF